MGFNGGGGGSVTLPITNEGDLIAGNASGVATRLPAGNPNQIPASDSTNTNTGLTYQYPIGKNYLLNPTFESGVTTGWGTGNVSLTNNIPTGTPTFGSGASGTLSIAVSPTAPIAGLESLTFIDTSANVAGNFLASSAFTIDLEDQAKVLSFKFSYKFTNGTVVNSGTATSSFGAAIYDVTNSAWIIPPSPFVFNQGTGIAVVSGTFQTPANASSLRLVIYCANAVSGGSTLFLDDFSVGPIAANTNAPGIAAAANTLSSTSITANTALQFTVTTLDTNAGITTGAGYKYTVPVSGAYLITFVGNTTTAGSGGFYVAKNGGFTFASANSLCICTTTQGASGSLVMSLNANDTIQLASNSSITAINTNASFSITCISNQTVAPANPVVALFANTTTTAATTTVPFKFTVIANDSMAGYSATTGQYTVPVTGLYSVAAQVNTAGIAALIIRKNAANLIVGNQINGGSLAVAVDSLPFNAGDLIDLVPSASVTATGTALNSFFTVTLVANPANAANQNVTVAFKGTNTAGTSIANTGDNNVPFATTVYDTFAAWTGTQYRVPIAGKYQVTGTVNYSSQTYGVNNQVIASIYKNTVLDSYGDVAPIMAIVTLPFGSNVSTTIQCLPGDLLELRAQNTRTAGATTLNTGAGFNHLEIERIGS